MWTVLPVEVRLRHDSALPWERGKSLLWGRVFTRHVGQLCCSEVEVSAMQWFQHNHVGDVSIWWYTTPFHRGLSQHRRKVGGGERVVDELYLTGGVGTDIVDVVLDREVSVLHEERVRHHLRRQQFCLRL